MPHQPTNMISEEEDQEFTQAVRLSISTMRTNRDLEDQVVNQDVFCWQAVIAHGPGSVTGSYSVFLPDGRTQHVKEKIT